MSAERMRGTPVQSARADPANFTQALTKQNGRYAKAATATSTRDPTGVVLSRANQKIPRDKLTHHSYIVGDRIGEGGLAEVYSGKQISPETPVAIKVLKNNIAFDQAETLRLRFIQEGIFLTGFNHPNILQCYGVFRQHDVLYLVLELLNGESLSQFLSDELAQRRRSPLSTIMQIVLPVLDALGEVHAKGVIHRDLKPDNIFLCSSDSPGIVVPKLIDFGLSLPVERDKRLTSTGSFLGTPAYMSPEQIYATVDTPEQRQPMTSRADLYSFGIVLYELLEGRPPFVSKRETSRDRHSELLRMQISNAPPSLTVSTPDKLCAVVSRLLEKNPEKRFATVAEVKEALVDATKNETESTSLGILGSVWNSITGLFRGTD